MQGIGLDRIDYGALGLTPPPRRDQEQQAEDRAAERRSQERGPHQPLGRKIRQAAEALASGKPIEDFAQELAGAAHGDDDEPPTHPVTAASPTKAISFPRTQARSRTGAWTSGAVVGGDGDGLIALAEAGSGSQAIAAMRPPSSTGGSMVRTAKRRIQDA